MLSLSPLNSNRKASVRRYQAAAGPNPVDTPWQRTCVKPRAALSRHLRSRIVTASASRLSTVDATQIAFTFLDIAAKKTWILRKSSRSMRNDSPRPPATVSISRSFNFPASDSFTIFLALSSRSSLPLVGILSPSLSLSLFFFLINLFCRLSERVYSLISQNILVYDTRRGIWKVRYRDEEKSINNGTDLFHP